MLTELRRPRALVDGDVVRVIAPSGPIDPDRLQAGAHLLESWGLQVEVGEHVLGRTRHGYLAGTDAERASDFVRAWCDPTVAAVMCARGGYGAHRMVDLVDWSALRAARHDDPPPALVGFSDVTALHEAVGVELGVASLLGPMVASYRFHEDEVSQQHLRDTLFGKDPGPRRRRRRPHARARHRRRRPRRRDRHAARRRASAAGPPAARSRVPSSCSRTSTSPPTGSTARSPSCGAPGVLDDVAAVVGGQWVECGDPDTIDELLLDRLGGLGVPMVNGVDVGHGHRHLTVPLGVRAHLDADDGELVAGPATAG